ncbi:ArnT family glycosyltransferase, partial [Chloroflexota bacterium]
MTKGRRAAALVLLAAALGLAALGQFYFFRRQDYVWDGVVFYGLAVLCFVLAWRQILRQKPRPSPSRAFHLSDWVRGRPVPTALMVVGLVLCFGATLLSQGRAWNQSASDVTTLWLLGLGAVLMSALWPARFPPQLPQDPRARLRAVSREAWLETALVIGLAVLAFMLRASGLEDVPYTLGGDEAWHGLLARQVLNGQLRNPFVMGYMSMPTFFYWPLSWSLWLVGDSVIGLRMQAAVAGTATVLVLYFFVRHLWGRRMAVLGAIFLATYDYHLHYSRLGANNIWDPLFLLLTLWLLDLGLTRPDEAGRTRYLTLTGLVMGLSTYFYTGARLLPVLIAAYVAFVWIKRRQPGSRKLPAGGLVWPLLMFVLAFLVVAGPMLSYALSHPDEWNARVNQVGIIQSGWLAREPGLTGKGTGQILAEQFLRAAGAFHVFPDRTAWYGADRPLLGFLPGVFAILGMAWALIHWQERRCFLVLIWFWAVVITGGMLTESPPSSQRLVMAAPAVALLVAIGLEQTVNL